MANVKAVNQHFTYFKVQSNLNFARNVPQLLWLSVLAVIKFILNLVTGGLLYTAITLFNVEMKKRVSVGIPLRTIYLVLVDPVIEEYCVSTVSQVIQE